MIKRFPTYVEKKGIKIDLDEKNHFRYYITIPIANTDKDPKKVLVIMKNPSKAKIDHVNGIYESDTTVNRVLNYFKKAGFSEVTIVNLFARYFTQSEELNKYMNSPEEIIGEKNDLILSNMIDSDEFECIVVAWGGYPKDAKSDMKGFYRDRIRRVEELLLNKNVYYVEKMVEKGKFPKHAMIWFVDEIKPMEKYQNVYYKGGQ